MKKLLSAVIMLALVSGAAWASVPDPEYCEVLPGDEMAVPRLLGITKDAGGSPYWDLDIHVAAFGGVSLANVYVQVMINTDCDADLCTCSGLVLDGFTDANGDVSFEVRLGGCCEMTAAVIIMADDVPIRQYDFVVSPDITSAVGGGDCQVVLADFSAFGAGLGAGAAGCTDFTGSGNTVLGDFVVFGAGWGGSCTTD